MDSSLDPYSPSSIKTAPDQYTIATQLCSIIIVLVLFMKIAGPENLNPVYSSILNMGVFTIYPSKYTY